MNENQDENQDEKFGKLLRSPKDTENNRMFTLLLSPELVKEYCLVLSIEYTLGTKKGLNQLIVFM